MDKKTLKVIEKYSMPFVQLVIEKGEEDSIFSDLTQIKQVAEETGLPSFLAQVAVDELDKEKTVRFFQDDSSNPQSHHKKDWIDDCKVEPR